MKKTFNIICGTFRYHLRRFLLALLDACGYDTAAARQERLTRRIEYYEATKRGHLTPTTTYHINP